MNDELILTDKQLLVSNKLWQIENKDPSLTEYIESRFKTLSAGMTEAEIIDCMQEAKIKKLEIDMYENKFQEMNNND